MLTVRLEVCYTLMREAVLRHRKVRSPPSNRGAAKAELPEPVQPDVKSNDSSGGARLREASGLQFRHTSSGGCHALSDFEGSSLFMLLGERARLVNTALPARTNTHGRCLGWRETKEQKKGDEPRS